MTNPNVRLDLEALKVLLSKATPGDWKFDGDWHRIPTFVSADGKYLAYAAKAGFPEHDSHTPEQAANAALIVAMRNALPDLIAHIERLQECVAGFVGALTDYGRNRDNVLSIDHDGLCVRVKQARATLSQGKTDE